MLTEKTGTLYIVSTPIGNPGDITIRAKEVLNTVDLILCEERKIGARLLKQLGISKTLRELNEHNEQDLIQDVVVELMNGKDLALISDCGTPVFSDPGAMLLSFVSEMKIPVVPIPGVSSLMTAISICPLNLKNFFFGGFLPPKNDQRLKTLQKYSHMDCPIILMDTPYRLSKLLQEVSFVYGKKQSVFLACDLTLANELFLQGPIQEIINKVGNRKAEFILVVNNPRRKKFVE